MHDVWKIFEKTLKKKKKWKICCHHITLKLIKRWNVWFFLYAIKCNAVECCMFFKHIYIMCSKSDFFYIALYLKLFFKNFNLCIKTLIALLLHGSFTTVLRIWLFAYKFSNHPAVIIITKCIHLKLLNKFTHFLRFSEENYFWNWFLFYCARQSYHRS